MKFLALVVSLAPVISLAADSPIPIAEGTTWNYELVQIKPSGSLDLTEPDEKETLAVTYRLGASQKVDNKDLSRLEIYRGEELESIDLIAIEEPGIICPARLDAKGAVVKLVPPQTMVPASLAKGARWKFDGTIGETKVNQDYEIAGQEDVDVPAGKFQAWRIHCEQTLPAPASSTNRAASSSLPVISVFSFPRQRNADDFLAVARNHATLRKRRMRPDDDAVQCDCGVGVL